MGSRKRKCPIGIDDFEKLIKEGFYYVDKTGLIIELLDNWGEVNLFTRPRRFGKSLNMSMLQHFFEMGTDKALFDGRFVSKDTALCEEWMGQYPVISLTLKDVWGKQVIVLIDEYDVPLQKAEAGGYYEEMVAFISRFFNRGMKTNPSMKLSVVTGCLRIAIEVKYSRKVSELEADAREALDQTRDNKYDRVFGRHVPERIVHYGISFCKTDCRVLKE